jgi:hypothetical protein
VNGTRVMCWVELEPDDDGQPIEVLVSALAVRDHRGRGGFEDLVATDHTGAAVELSEGQWADAIEQLERKLEDRRDA